MYEYERQHALIITTSTYDGLKTDNGQPIPNVPVAYHMGSYVEDRLRELGFKDVVKISDPSFAQLRKALATINARINEDEAEDVNGLLFVYYCGHGFYDGKTFHSVQGNSEKMNAKRSHPLEEEIRYYSTNCNSMFCCLFDCTLLNHSVSNYDLDTSYTDDTHYMMSFSTTQPTDGNMPPNFRPRAFEYFKAIKDAAPLQGNKFVYPVMIESLNSFKHK